MLRLFTLGELRLETDDGRLLSRRRKPLVLLTYLACRAPRPVSRTELAALLWGQRAEPRARQSLRQALLELKELIGAGIEITHDAVRVDEHAVELDLTAFELDVGEGRDREAVARWAGEFMDGAEDAGEMALSLWLATERAALHRRLAFAFARLLEATEQRGAWREAITIARRWAEACPLDERACIHLITALRRDERVVDALACHASFVSRVREELNAQPSRPFLALAEPLDESVRASQHGGGASGQQSALPFVGRELGFSALTSAWKECGGEGGVVIIEAEHGMGSTRLCDEFGRWVRSEDTGALLLRTTPAIAALTATPYGYAAVLLARMWSAPALAGLSEATLSMLAQMLPRLRERFPHLPSRAQTVPPSDMAAAVGEALDGITDDARVLVIADGFDSADADSRALVLQLASSERGAVLFVIVCRPPENEWDAVLMALRSAESTRFLLLAPVSAEDIAEILESVSHLDGDDRAELARTILDDTGGMPAYAASVIEALVDERVLSTSQAGYPVAGLVRERELPAPGRIRTMLSARTGVLDSAARRLLDAVAVYGAPFTTADAERLTSLAPNEAATALDALVRARIVRAAAAGSRYELAPPVIARALYALVPLLQRDAFHAAAAKLTRRRSRWWRTGPAGDGRFTHHLQRTGAAPASRWSRTRWRAGIAAAIVAMALGAVYAIPRRSATVPDRAVAIFPFAVSNDAKFAFLRNGMVDLLSTSLDGAAGLRSVDPRAVLAATGPTAADRPLTPDDARQIAGRLGATYFVLGTVVAGAGSLEIGATLYDMRAGARGIAHASAAGNEAGLFGVVDRLTAQLAVAQGAGSNERLTHIAAVTTTSLDALKAYLAGRDAYRANDLLAALPAFERAVAADSSFALAWYGLATTASWTLRSKLERHAAAEAVANEGRLSMRDRTLVEAFAAYSRGAADTAEQLTGSIVEAYDDDVEAWALLGEILYHHNWKRGRSLVESRRAWEHVLALDPNYWPALQHLSEVAAFEGNVRQVNALLDRYERSVGTEHMPITSLALRAYGSGDGASRDAIASRVATDRGFWLTLSIWYVAVIGENVDGGRRLARFLVDPVRPPEQQGFGRILLAHLALAQGRWREARAELAIARVHSPKDALEYQLLLSMAPFLSVSGAELERQRSELEQQPISDADGVSTMPWPYRFSGMHEIIRPFVAGMASARRGDAIGRKESLAQLARVRDSMGLGHGFAATIRAEQLRMAKQPEAALRELEKGALATPFVQSWTSGFVSQGYERYERAELLHQLGRDDEALRWYATFAENSPYDLVYLAPAIYREAQIYDSRGQKVQAARRYAQFLNLWKSADPEFQSVIDDARRRLAQLQ